MTAQESKLSADEIALYDRQIRLWGIDAQTRIRSCKILIINLSAVALEILKNLMLSGVGQLTIIDDTVVREEDLDSNFFINSDSIGAKKLNSAFDRIKELNPRVDLQIELSTVKDQSDEWFLKFDLIIATELSEKEILRVNGVARLRSIPFYSTGLHGLYGYIFTDLISHVSTTETPLSSVLKKLGKVNSVTELISIKRVKQNDQLVDISELQKSYKPFSDIGGADTVDKLKEFFNTKRKMNRLSIILPCILTLLKEYPSNYETNIDDINIPFEEFQPKLMSILQKLQLTNLAIDPSQIQNLLQQAYTQFQPTAAIIGGTVAQDVIQFLSRKPCLNNFVILDASESKMPIFTI